MPEISKAKLIELSEAKLADAKILIAAGRSANAYYLAGYAVELMLKAILSSQFKTDTIPDRTLTRDIFVHDLARLTKLANLDGELKTQIDLDVSFDGYWRTVLIWDQASRYDNPSLDEAAQLIRAIDDPTHGVLQWLQRKL